MKGTSFQKPLELNLFVDGESWFQGDTVSGSLVVKNHGAQEVPLSEIQVRLAQGHLTKVRQKSPEAFKLLSSVVAASSGHLAAKGEHKLEWKFATDRNFPITDKSSSPFLLYGVGEGTDKLGQLQLLFQPTKLIQDFLQVLQIEYRFVLKSQKSSKGRVEVKLEPSSSRTFVSLEQLLMRFQYEGDTLSVGYEFTIKKVDASSGAMGLKKEKKEFQQDFTRDQYQLPSGRFNHERVEMGVKEVLGQLGLSAFIG